MEMLSFVYYCNMKRIAIFCLLLCSFAKLRSQEDSILIPMLTPEEMHQDIRYLRWFIMDAHIDPQALIDTTAYLRGFDSIISIIQEPLGASEFYAMLAPVFYRIDDAHCALGLPPSSNNYLQNGGLYLPIKVRFIDTSMYIVSDYFEKITPGSQLISVNGIPANIIRRQLLDVCSSDGDNDYTRMRVAEYYFHSLLPIFFDIGKENSVWACYGDTATEFVLPGVPRKTGKYRAWFAENHLTTLPEPTFDLRFYKDGAIAYLRIASFSDGAIGEYRTFLGEAFRSIRAHKSQSLILDIRGNGGGYADRGRTLLRFLFDAPFTYLSNIVSKSSRGARIETIRSSPFNKEYLALLQSILGSKPMRTMWHKPFGTYDTTSQKIVKPVNHHLIFNGKIFVLIDGMSASTTGLVCNTLRTRTNVLFIGEPAGCTMYGTFGQPIEFQLPNSGIIGYMSSMRFNQREDCRISTRPIKPDFIVDPEIEDWLNDIDTQLNFVFDLIEKDSVQ